MTNANMSRRHDDDQTPDTGRNGEAAPLDGELTRLDPQEAAAIAADDRGQRVGRIITTKDYANGRDPNAIIAGSPPGTRILLGSLRGVVEATERSTHTYKDKPLESVWLNGEFEAVVAETGEVKAAPTAILPKAFGITIETAGASIDRYRPRRRRTARTPSAAAASTSTTSTTISGVGRNEPLDEPPPAGALR